MFDTLLYTDETGETVGLDEVQLMRDELQDRIPALTNLLTSTDQYLAYQAGLILGAWGTRSGINYLHSFIVNRLDRQTDFEPHRIWGEDNVYDVIAEALEISVSVYHQELQPVLNLFKELLALYGDVFFESKLKLALLKLDASSLLPNIRQALQAALQAGRFYQASQLLPVLAKYDKPYMLTLLPQFESLQVQDERIRYNIDEVKYPIIR